MGQTQHKPMKQWADGPFQLIETPRKRRGITDLKKEPGAISAATDMCLIHNCMIRIMNCIYLQAPNVKLEQDITDFTTFMYALVILLHEHHGNEEKHFFPWLEEDIGVPGWMEKNVDQHHAFAPAFDRFEQHVESLRKGEETFDGTKIQKLIDDFAPVLTEHLSDEIGTFEELESLGDKIDWKKWNKRVSDLAVKTAEKYHEIPVAMTNMDIPFEKPFHQAVWPPFPWIAAVMFRWFYLPRHKGAWRFSCCDWYGKPKELEFI